MPNNIKVQFKRGSLANLPVSVADGTIYVTTDEHAMYVDNGNQRIRIGDFIPVNNVTDLPASGHAYETAVYYVKNGNILARWDKTNSRWIQINKAGVVGINDTGTGNVITGITMVTDSTDGTLRLQITRASVATADDLADLIDRVAAAEEDIDDLETQVGTWAGGINDSGSILNLIETAITNILASVSGLDSRVGDVEDDIDSLEPRVQANEDAIAILNGDASTTGSVKKQVADAIARIVANAPDDFDTLKEISDWISGHGSDAAAMNTAISDLQDDLSALEQRVSDAEDDIDTLQTDLGTANTNITNLQNAVNTLNGNSSVAGSVDQKIATALSTIETRLDDVEDNADLALDHLTWKEF